ncbi:MAG TPA: anthranilate synthase component I family protein [Candidatus Methylacidiphilales bacterium]|jgi:anthranilate/para-aminobenzoate synthase component I|nr:anthranilate synthase component I family protein [Candidatus Methylacidiphilales bacterium]
MSFFSLNSWNEPGTILQAAEPEEIVAGGWDEWDKLRDLLARRRKTGGDSVHPQSAAVGYFTYEGAFRFAWFPRISILRENGFSALWNERCADWVARALRARGSGAERETYPGPQSQRARRTECDGYPWRADMPRAQFESIVARAQEYIAAGDIYQVNLAQKFTTRFEGNPYRLFEHLLARSPAPGGAFLDFGTESDGVRILSASPEMFLRVRGRHVTTRPIKGTRPRSRDPVLDQQLAFELRNDPKELAELIMITDLERNDLGQICEYGSVVVTQLAQLEHFPQVHHLVSTIEGLLRPGIDALDAVRACIPGGSISGAPKKRAREIIAELEPCARGIYTGLIGYFDDSGDAAFSIAIRTMIHEGATLHFSVGSGITSGSVPAREYDETLHKAAGMQMAIEAYAASAIRRPERAN